MSFLCQSIDLNLKKGPGPWPLPLELTPPLSVFLIVCCVFGFFKQGSKEHDSVTNRVAGFICKHVFTEHSSCVTGLAVVGREAGYNTTYLVRFRFKVKHVSMLELRGVRLPISTIFCCLERLGVSLLPLLIPRKFLPALSILSFFSTHLYSGVKRDTVRVNEKSLLQERNTMTSGSE